MQTATRADIGTVTRIPIGELTVDSNIRRDTKMKPGFAANVKQHGVLEPVDAYQDDNGAWHLQDGQLRYLASLDADHTDIPVLVQDPALAEGAKLIKQLNKNQQRSELTEADEANAWQTLFELGVSADAIAKKTNRPRKAVEQALEVNKSDVASKALEAGIGLDKAAIITEFAEHPEIAAQLAEKALSDPGRFAYAVESAKRDIVIDARRQVVVAALDAAGVTIVEHGPEMATLVPLGQVYIDAKFMQFATKEDVPAAALRAMVGSRGGYVDEEWTSIFEAVYYVDDPDAAGLFVKPATPSGKLPMTEKEQAERKRVIANNKAWPIATKVRRDWIAAELLNRGSLPSDVVQFAAIGYAGGHPKSSYGSGGTLTREWLDIKDTDRSNIDLVIDELVKKPGSATKVILALALGNAEESLSNKDAWRDSWQAPKIARYLEQLASWGHNLSDVEAEIVKAGKK